ncbi:MAG: hypothetical protein V1834_02885 [Candidatus Micrarchaeota archaeon]
MSDKMLIVLEDRRGKDLCVYGINLPQEFPRKISFKQQKSAAGLNVYHYLQSHVEGRGHATELLRRLRRVFEVLAHKQGKPVEHVVNTTVRKLAPDYAFKQGLNIGRKLFEAQNHELEPDELKVLKCFEEHLRRGTRKG